MGDPGDQLIAITRALHGGDKIGEAGGVGDGFGQGAAVEIRPDPYPVLAELFQHVVEMTDGDFEARVAPRMLAVLTQEAAGEVEADKAPGLGDSIELPVSEVARRRRQRVDVGMAGDQRLVRHTRHIPESLFIEVGEVDHQSALIADPDKLDPRTGQPIALVGAAGKGEGHAIAEDVVPAPGDADRAQTAGVKFLECLKAGIDHLGALDMVDHGHRIGGHGGANLGRSGAEPHRAAGPGGQFITLVHHCEGVFGRALLLDRGAHGRPAGQRAAGTFWIGREHRKEPARKAPCPRLGHVEVKAIGAAEEIRLLVLPVGLDEAQEGVVVAVEHRKGGGHRELQSHGGRARLNRFRLSVKANGAAVVRQRHSGP